jgi:predicted HicB family RNase H-like nuclease
MPHMKTEKSIRIRVDDKVHRALKTRAAQEGSTMTQLILSALMQAGALSTKSIGGEK